MNTEDLQMCLKMSCYSIVVACNQCRAVEVRVSEIDVIPKTQSLAPHLCSARQLTRTVRDHILKQKQFLFESDIL